VVRGTAINAWRCNVDLKALPPPSVSASARESQYAVGDRGFRSSRFLLSGFARCAVCGGGFASHSRDHGSRRAYFYGCVKQWALCLPKSRFSLIALMLRSAIA
jgi:hypothetical protein